MSGKGCRVFETNSKYSFMDLIKYLYENSDDYNITRIDLAYDDFSGIFDMQTLISDVRAKNYITKTRKWKKALTVLQFILVLYTPSSD